MGRTELGMEPLGCTQAFSVFRTRLGAVSAELEALGRAASEGRPFSPGGLYSRLLAALAPLARRGLVRARTFERERARHADDAASELFAQADELVERLLAIAALEGPGDLRQALAGVAWHGIEDAPDLPSAISALEGPGGPRDLLQAWDRAAKAWFSEYVRGFPHDGAWYRRYLRELEDRAFLLRAVPDGEVERELNRFLSLLLVAYPWTCRSVLDGAPRPALLHRSA